jgi:hypothetical protein
VSVSQVHLEIQEILKKAYNGQLKYLDALEKIEVIVNPGPPLHWGKRIECLVAAFKSYRSDDFHFVMNYFEDNQTENFVDLLVTEVVPEQIDKFKEIARDLTKRFGIDVRVNMLISFSGKEEDEASEVA